jgi:uncharacterized protein (TIGR02266 family)
MQGFWPRRRTMSDETSPYPVEQKNLRRALRSPLIVEKLPCGDGRKTFFGYAKNISRGGLFIATVNPREPGDQFDLELLLPAPNSLLIRCRCEVVWKRVFERKGKFEPGMGLRFLDLPEATGEAIDLWVRGCLDPTAR